MAIEPPVKTTQEIIDSIIEGDYTPDDVIALEEYLKSLFTHTDGAMAPATYFINATATYSPDRLSHATASYLIRSLMAAMQTNTWMAFEAHVNNYQILPRDETPVDYYNLNKEFDVGFVRKLTAIDVYHCLVDNIGIATTLKFFKLLNK